MTVRSLILTAAVAGMALFSLPSQAEAQLSAYGSPRQYYSSWTKHPSKPYHYRRLYYKPENSYVGYKHHYVIYYPTRPKHCYFFNPYKKQFWGRCAIQHGGKYSLLPVQARKPTLEEIPETAFPSPLEPPPLPESLDKLALDLPPDDLPLR